MLVPNEICLKNFIDRLPDNLTYAYLSVVWGMGMYGYSYFPL